MADNTNSNVVKVDLGKKLQIRSEMIRHLETAKEMADAGYNSSMGNVISLQLELHRLDVKNEVLTDAPGWWENRLLQQKSKAEK